MKAFLLCAGKGTRLRPLTDRIPKCLVPISGKPLLEYWVELLQKYGVSEVLINLHHLVEQVRAYLKNREFPIQIHEFYEPQLLGSAGTVAANKDFVKSESEFFILYADNLTNINLKQMLDFHHRKHSPFTCALFNTENPSAGGIVQLDANGVIVDFEEKPQHPKGTLANAGIFIASPSVFKFISQKIPCDLGYDVLPRMIGQMYGYEMKEFLIDIGTLESYHKAQEIWPTIAMET